jgi:[ribosomal protein S5]-alanine N-acetyltransferase
VVVKLESIKIFMNIIETKRLNIRELVPSDAVFILELLNEPAFIANIGDRNVRTLPEAARYILSGPALSYENNEFGLWHVEHKETKEAIGICGLIKRDSLEDIDIGFAFLEKFCGKGYATEAAEATFNYARDVVEIKRLVAITVPSNKGSIRVLEKIGLKFEKMIKLPHDENELMLFGVEI